MLNVWIICYSHYNWQHIIINPTINVVILAENLVKFDASKILQDQVAIKCWLSLIYFPKCPDSELIDLRCPDSIFLMCPDSGIIYQICSIPIFIQTSLTRLTNNILFNKTVWPKLVCLRANLGPELVDH